MWHFDRCGYLLIKNVMDPAWIAVARAAIDANLERIIYRGVGKQVGPCVRNHLGILCVSAVLLIAVDATTGVPVLSCCFGGTVPSLQMDGDVTLAAIPGAPTIAGTGRPDLQGLLALPAPHCEPFRKMLAHPAVLSRLAWMQGPGAVCTQHTVRHQLQLLSIVISCLLLSLSLSRSLCRRNPPPPLLAFAAPLILS